MGKAGTFAHVTMSEKQIKEAESLRDKATELEDLFNNVVSTEERSDSSRLMNIAKTNLEQSIMWAIKAVSRKLFSVSKFTKWALGEEIKGYSREGLVMNKLLLRIKLFWGIPVYFDDQIVVGVLKNKRGERIVSYCPERDKFYEDNISWLENLSSELWAIVGKD